MGDCGHWDITRVGQFDPTDYDGFIYRITDAQGRHYIGKKSFTSNVTLRHLKARNGSVRSRRNPTRERMPVLARR
ncbi:hypothetical protein [Thalassobacterium maritimum]|uniref:hypothetical protein n=1 Tax=Thalassobacterium maritimum TaxID=3041265 RepID=UPI003CE59B92